MQDGKNNLQDTKEASTGVYVGCVWQEYQVLLDHLRVTPTVAVLTGSGMNFMVGRVSYTFGLQGASHNHPTLFIRQVSLRPFRGFMPVMPKVARPHLQGQVLSQVYNRPFPSLHKAYESAWGGRCR